MWYDVVERMDPDAFTVHMLDFRGCGTSDRPMDGHTLTEYTWDARTALAWVDRPVVIVAHSMGGKVAQYLAAMRPDNLRGLLLAAPGTGHGGRRSERLRAIAMESYGSRVQIDKFQRSAMGVEWHEETMMRIIDDALIAQREHWIGWFDHGRFVDFRERLSNIAVPTLCIGGARDPLLPPTRLKTEVVQSIPDAIGVTLKHAGHNLPVEAPDEMTQAIVRFCSSV